MRLTDDDLRALYKAHPGVFVQTAAIEHVRAMLDDAFAKHDTNTNTKLDAERRAAEHDAFVRRIVAGDAVRKHVGRQFNAARAEFERAVMDRVQRDGVTCTECGAPYGTHHSPTCAAQSPVITIEDWQRGDVYGAIKPPRDEHGTCRECGATEGSEHGTECPALHKWLDMMNPRPRLSAAVLVTTASDRTDELTPAERTWRAHKGFSR